MRPVGGMRWREGTRLRDSWVGEGAAQRRPRDMLMVGEVTEELTLCLVLVLVGQVVGSGPGDQLHVGGSVHLNEKETLLPSFIPLFPLESILISSKVSKSQYVGNFRNTEKINSLNMYWTLAKTEVIMISGSSPKIKQSHEVSQENDNLKV